MSIPLDQLYHYIDQCAQKSYGDLVIIYRFYPHGSKDLRDLNFLNDHQQMQDILLCPHVYCNDQEPLDFERYEHETVLDPDTLAVTKSINNNKMNLRDYPANVWDHALLLHSEQRSAELVQYQNNGFIPVYYWSHAVIAQDWFRFARHTVFCKNIKKTFLIYNRAWSGTREYRLKFSEYVIRLGLVDHCQTTVNPIEPELNIHYELHNFKNTAWRPHHVIEDYLPVSDAHSHYSATFDADDYNQTDIEVVLETLFDDARLHLTEKSLRPIACAQPFIIAGTAGSLEYLRGYGFKTFGDVWDEHYDLIEDPHERLCAIVDLMNQIANWAPRVRAQKMAKAQVIAEYNRQHFFSTEFFDLVTDELQNNLDSAFAQLRAINTSQRWLDTQDLIYKNLNKLTNSTMNGFSYQDWTSVVDQVKALVSKHQPV
jgi:hypothetical protein